MNNNKDHKELGIFDKISNKYREKSTVQQKAAENLLDLLKIGEIDNVIDIGCGWLWTWTYYEFNQ